MEDVKIWEVLQDALNKFISIMTGHFFQILSRKAWYSTRLWYLDLVSDLDFTCICRD